MKKEIFDRIIEAVKPLYLNRHTNEENFKIVENDEFISYYFDESTPKEKESLEYYKNYFKEHGWKHDVTSDIVVKCNEFGGRPVRRVLSILYNKVKNSISIAEFEHGYTYAYKKGRFYPFKTNIPLFCYSKQLYTFINHRRYRGVRIMKGGRIAHKHSDIITQAILNINYRPTLDKVLTKNFMNTKNEAEVIEKMYNVKIPKLLTESFSSKSLDLLCKVLENPGEMNRLCQFIAAKNKKKEEGKQKATIVTTLFLEAFSESGNNKYSLTSIIAEMCFNDDVDTWLIQDWLEDHYDLDKKLSLKISSVKRVRDEHAKLSRERILRGVKHVKMHDLYKDLFKDFPIPVEEVNSKKRLLEESIEQEHCVATYADKINRGDCGIFSIVFNNTRYTLEVSRILTLIQLQGFRNGKEGHHPPQELRDMILRHLSEYKIALGEKAPKEEKELFELL